jgi:hypothetical protein
LIENFDQIEEAKFTLLDFKSDLLGLIAYCNELTNQIDAKGLAPCFHPVFDLEVYRLKVDQVY